LSGITVLELGNLLAGPFYGMLLGDMGADVVKIEPRRGCARSRSKACTGAPGRSAW
jgi:formyl-CoA transferase